jgi:hypothetical protein
MNIAYSPNVNAAAAAIIYGFRSVRFIYLLHFLLMGQRRTAPKRAPSIRLGHIASEQVRNSIKK